MSSISSSTSFMISLIISILFFVIKFFERKYMMKYEDEPKPFKYIIRDTFVVYFSSFIGLFIIEQINGNVETKSHTIAYTNQPDF
jgi:hypothetical protein